MEQVDREQAALPRRGLQSEGDAEPFLLMGQPP